MVIIYVSTTGSSSNDGLSWSAAKSDVQEAIDLASEYYGAEVWIAKGTYKHGSEMTMKNNVAIYGGFAGTESSIDRRVAGNNTILDGEGKYRVFHNSYSSSNRLTNSAKLDNVTIQNGYVSDEDDSSISTSDDGAGMYNVYASPEITNCTFHSNTASNNGGGMYNDYYSSPTLTNCTFSDNSAHSSGGMCNDYYSSPVLTNCTFTNNSASSSGGGMYNNSSSPVLINCTFTNNSVSPGSGGGMYNNGNGGTCSPVLTNCTFSNNSASSGGGMLNRSSSSPTLTNCILWGNTASNSGNEIYNLSSNNNPTIDTCIIKGGKDGIYNSDYCTFTTEPITADPKLMPLGNYGGSVQTCPVGAGSSAIGTGKVVEGVTTDARGFARSSTPTIGAYEYIVNPEPDPDTPVYYTLTVENGFIIDADADGTQKTSGTYAANSNINIKAVDITDINKKFKEWSSNYSSESLFADSSSINTTITMPNSDVVVFAVFDVFTNQLKIRKINIATDSAINDGSYVGVFVNNELRGKQLVTSTKNTDTITSITNGDNYITIGVCDNPNNCGYDYYFDNSFIQKDNLTNTSTLNFKHNSDKFKLDESNVYYIDPFYSGTDNSFTVAEKSQTITYSFKEQNSTSSKEEQNFTFPEPDTIKNEVNNTAYTIAESNLVCQYGNPFYGANCPNGTELPGGSQCTITTSVEKFIINDIEVCVAPNEELSFYLQTDVGDCYSVGSTFTPELNTCYINKEEQPDFILNCTDTAYENNCPTWEEERTTCKNFVNHKFSISVNNNRNDDKNVDFAQVATLFVYTLDENNKKIKLAEITNIQSILSPVQKSYATYDACLDKNTLTSQSSTAEALTSAKTIVKSQLDACLAQNMEVKAFCDKLSMYVQLFDDLLNADIPDFKDWEDRIIVSVDRSGQTFKVENDESGTRLKTSKGIIYAYINQFHNEDRSLDISFEVKDAEQTESNSVVSSNKSYSCYNNSISHCGTDPIDNITLPNEPFKQNGLTIYVDTPIQNITDINTKVENILITPEPVETPTEELKEFSFYFTKTDGEFTFDALIVKSSNELQKVYKGFNHCIAIEPNRNTVDAGSFTSKDANDSVDLNKKAINLAISGLACLYGNACTDAFQCWDTTTRFGYSISPVCQGTVCSGSGNSTTGCAYYDPATKLNENIFLADDPWKADLQALTTQLSTRICLACDKVGYSSGGGGGTASVSASCSASCSGCTKAFSVFTS